MAATDDDRARRALDLLRTAPFSHAVNAFVLTSDMFYELAGILEGDNAVVELADDAEPEVNPPAKKGAKKRAK